MYIKVIEGMNHIGELEADGALPAASCVKVTGNKKVAEQSDGDAVSFAFNIESRASGAKTTLAHGPGYFETDNLYGSPVAGSNLAYKPDTHQFKIAGEGEVAVALVVSISDGVALCKSLVM
jgi:hypothetical protein